MGFGKEIIYERPNPGEPALIVRLEGLHDLEGSEIQTILEKVGLGVDEFGRLLRNEISPIEGPSEEQPIFGRNGAKIEDAVTSIVPTSIGPIEVADCKLYPAVVTGVDDQSLHLRMGPKGGFEVICVLDGEADIEFPETVEPVAAGLYVASQKRDSVHLAPGMLALIPAPTANTWTGVGEGFKFRYICQPRWDPSFVVPVLDQ